MIGLYLWFLFKKLLWEVREINLCDILTIFLRMQSQVLPVLVIEGDVWYFRSLHPPFEISSDTEHLYKQLLVFGNVIFVVFECLQWSWWFSYNLLKDYRATSPKRKQKFSKTVLSTFQKTLFELCSAGFFGCNWKSCFENFLRSLST